VTGSILISGIQGFDDLHLSGAVTGTFATKAAGSNKTVNADLSGLSIGGTDTGNYEIAGLGGGLTASIGKAALTVSGLTAHGKTYDGGTTAVLTGNGGLAGVIGSDVVSLSGSSSGTFADKAVGTGRTVNVDASGFTLAGVDAGNYEITGFASALTASITKATLTVSGLAGVDKVYDGNANAALTGTAGLAGVIGSDAVTVSGAVTGAFADKNVGAAKTINASLAGLSLGGVDGGNYQIGGLASGFTANITKATLTVAGLSGLDKVYDGNTSATLTATAKLNGVIGSDQVTLAGAVGAAFQTADVGTGKTIVADLSGLSLTGADAGNYAIAGLSRTLAADITAAPVVAPPASTPPPPDPPTTAATTAPPPPPVQAATPPSWFANVAVTQPSLPQPVSSQPAQTVALVPALTPAPATATPGGLNYVFVSNDAGDASGATAANTASPASAARA
jgi:hypothetical protein